MNGEGAMTTGSEASDDAEIRRVIDGWPQRPTDSKEQVR
jgi:hypothetical protein